MTLHIAGSLYEVNFRLLEPHCNPGTGLELQEAYSTHQIQTSLLFSVLSSLNRPGSTTNRPPSNQLQAFLQETSWDLHETTQQWHVHTLCLNVSDWELDAGHREATFRLWSWAKEKWVPRFSWFRTRKAKEEDPEAQRKLQSRDGEQWPLSGLNVPSGLEKQEGDEETETRNHAGKTARTITYHPQFRTSPPSGKWLRYSPRYSCLWRWYAVCHYFHGLFWLCRQFGDKCLTRDKKFEHFNNMPWIWCHSHVASTIIGWKGSHLLLKYRIWHYHIFPGYTVRLSLKKKEGHLIKAIKAIVPPTRREGAGCWDHKVAERRVWFIHFEMQS